MLFYSSCWTPRKSIYRSSRHLKPISLAKKLHQVLKPKKRGAVRSLISLNAASNITHSAIASQGSSRVTTTFNAHCILYSTLYCGRFQRRFCESRRKVGTIQYRTVRMISRAGVQGTESWNRYRGEGGEERCWKRKGGRSYLVGQPSRSTDRIPASRLFPPHLEKRYFYLTDFFET